MPPSLLYKSRKFFGSNLYQDMRLPHMRQSTADYVIASPRTNSMGGLEKSTAKKGWTFCHGLRIQQRRTERLEIGLKAFLQRNAPLR